MVGFSIPRTFTLRSILPTPVIMREAEDEVAESIIEKITLAFREREGRRRWWERAGEEHFLTPFIRP